MTHEDEVNTIDKKVADRRAFLKSAGFTGLGLAAAGLAAGNLGAFDNTPVAKALGIKAPNVFAAEDIDLEILNFALNLEYLEAEFYTVATTSYYIGFFGIGTYGVGPHGTTTGGHKVDFSVTGNPGLTQMITNIATELAFDEMTHVTLLRSALGSNAVSKPSINLDALGIGFGNVHEFLTLARAFEDTGVSAYGGAAPLITNKTYLGAAARIAEVEANHSGNIRLLCALTGTSVGPLDALDVVPPPAGKNFFVVNSDALAVIRTTDQVLAIAYGDSASGTSKGGFFPNGLNGSITTIS